MTNFEMEHFFQLENSGMAQNSNHFWLKSHFLSNFEPKFMRNGTFQILSYLKVAQKVMHVTTLPLVLVTPKVYFRSFYPYIYRFVQLASWYIEGLLSVRRFEHFLVRHLDKISPNIASVN